MKNIDFLQFCNFFNEELKSRSVIQWYESADKDPEHFFCRWLLLPLPSIVVFGFLFDGEILKREITRFGLSGCFKPFYVSLPGKVMRKEIQVGLQNPPLGK